MSTTHTSILMYTWVPEFNHPGNLTAWTSYHPTETWHPSLPLSVNKKAMRISHSWLVHIYTLEETWEAPVSKSFFFCKQDTVCWFAIKFWLLIRDDDQLQRIQALEAMPNESGFWERYLKRGTWSTIYFLNEKGFPPLDVSWPWIKQLFATVATTAAVYSSNREKKLC